MKGNFSDMTLESEVSDAICGLNYLQQLPNLDKNRIGIFGRSVGGMVAILAARRHRGIKSLATWAPLFGGEEWEEQWKLLQASHITEDERMMKMRINGQVPGEDFLRQLFNIRMQEELNAISDIPFLNIHGEKDMIVITEHAYRYKKLREKARGKSKFIFLPESDHDFSNPKEQQIALNETTQWFKHTL